MKKLLAILFFLFLALIIYWADSGTMPEIVNKLYEFPYGDKVGHFVLYGTLAYLLTAIMPFRRVRVWRWSLPLSMLLAAGFATLEEFSQIFFPTRTPSFIDLFSGYSGIVAATILIPCLRWACFPVSKKDESSEKEN